ncbi:glycoside hydrolase family 1 protein [Streptomyces longisporoflavus]|uniref:Glycoside hydrolase family 1 protein n=1 Tax=Streptomyces longisporoflavus TaxID=28044 RepID=A0ABW7R1X6_9ACTN
MRDFPTDFLWGSATAAHQVEGGNTNSDWWEWEHRADSPAKESSADGIDHWNRYDQDFALLAALGQNAHRFSVEWARIEPAEGEFSQSAIDHYRRVLESLHRHGLTPFVTLYHFSLPRWFAERGGWLGADAVGLFGRYVERAVSALGDLAPYFGTVNEPQMVALMGYLAGGHPPGRRDIESAKQVNQTLATAHRVAVSAVRAGSGTSRVGTCLNLPHIEPFRPEEAADVATAARMTAFFADTHIDDLRSAPDPGDFVGVQYYSRNLADGTSPAMTAPPPADAELSQIGWEIYPQGLGPVLRKAAEAGLPVMVTENGIAALDDEQRVRFLASHLREVRSAVQDGVDVRGYFHWSAFDNYEWGTFEPRFGLIGVDHEAGMRRIVRPSVAYYGQVASTGDLEPLLQVARRLETDSRSADRRSTS